jgi:hypothetical protein
VEKIKSLIPLNWALLGNPINWVIVVLMIAIAGYSVALIFNNSTANGSNDQ